ncbi:MAG: hypothetical protein DME09_17950 [Candidatus Rokuibacteriota bacterium]|nr:MAG: hypothetical protein DME09_17950 [Candidatus Rokubacteria bacterium]
MAPRYGDEAASTPGALACLRTARVDLPLNLSARLGRVKRVVDVPPMQTRIDSAVGLASG